MLEVGTVAPEIILPNQDGKEIKLSDFRGKKVVLYFYSKDNTSGCNKQACGFAALNEQFEQKGAVVIGVSKDSSSTHKKFEEKFNLNFTLLADEEKQTLQTYGVWKEKNMYGKKVMGVVRTTYIINEEGIIEKVFAKVKPDENPAQMLEEI